MSGTDGVNIVREELRQGMSLDKCRKCGCMKETLEALRDFLSLQGNERSPGMIEEIQALTGTMEAIAYPCLGCEHCFPASAMNAFQQAVPEASQIRSTSCSFEVRANTWPPVPGEYHVLSGRQDCPVAVSTLGDAELAIRLADARPEGLSIVGKTETENIGIEKVVKNIITNPAIRLLLLAGTDPAGHASGATLRALGEQGVDTQMRVVGSPGRNPVLLNVSREDVDTFRRQVDVVDLIGCDDEPKIITMIDTFSRKQGRAPKPAGVIMPLRMKAGPVVQAKSPDRIDLDKTGYFVITPQPEKQIITVEHYSNENRILHVIEGRDARSIYGTIIENGWVTLLSHAAYLGRELARAEQSLEDGSRYVQDGA